MPIFKRADETVTALAAQLIDKYHEGLREQGVKIDFVFAYCDRDEVTLEPKNDAIKHHGVKAIGLTKKISLKDRAKGNGDAEILIDADWWAEANDEQRAALLDHELFHLVPLLNRDDLGRPKLKLRHHDYQFGWFTVIANRHRQNSLEVKQARQMMQDAGQYYWPELFNVQQPETSRIANLELAKV